MSTTPTPIPSIADAITAVEQANTSYSNAATQTANDQGAADAAQAKADAAQAVVATDQSNPTHAFKVNIPTTIELRSVRSLLPYARNSRTHSEQQVAQVAASIREFGWTSPILVDSEGIIIAGHARLLAAQQLGMAEVPVIVLAHLTPAQRRALVAAHNLDTL